MLVAALGACGVVRTSPPTAIVDRHEPPDATRDDSALSSELTEGARQPIYTRELDAAGDRTLLALGGFLSLSSTRLASASALPGQEVPIVGVPTRAGKVRARVILPGGDEFLGFIRRIDDNTVGLVTPLLPSRIPLPVDARIVVSVRGREAPIRVLRIAAPPPAPDQGRVFVNRASEILSRLASGSPDPRFLTSLLEANDLMPAAGADSGGEDPDLPSQESLGQLLISSGVMQSLEDLAAGLDAISPVAAETSTAQSLKYSYVVPPLITPGGTKLITADELKAAIAWRDVIETTQRNRWSQTARFGAAAFSTVFSTGDYGLWRLWWIAATIAAVQITEDYYLGLLPKSVDSIRLEGGEQTIGINQESAFEVTAVASTQGLSVSLSNALSVALLALSVPGKLPLAWQMPRTQGEVALGFGKVWALKQPPYAVRQKLLLAIAGMLSSLTGLVFSTQNLETYQTSFFPTQFLADVSNLANTTASPTGIVTTSGPRYTGRSGGDAWLSIRVQDFPPGPLTAVKGVHVAPFWRLMTDYLLRVGPGDFQVRFNERSHYYMWLIGIECRLLDQASISRP